MDSTEHSNNACFDNSGFNSKNSLTHLLDEEPDETPCIQLSEYIDVDAFVEKLSQVKSKLSVLSLNIQTINTKFDEFKIIIDQINKHHPISVICLQETHLVETDPTSHFEIEDYQLISKSRYCSNAGGLIIYLHKDFSYKHIELCAVQSDTQNSRNSNVINKPCWESLFIEIKHKTPNSKTHIMGIMYTGGLLI